VNGYGKGKNPVNGYSRFRGLPDRQKQRELESLEVARRMVGHPHIVGLVRYEWVGDYLVTIWEWADGGSLEDMLRQYQKQGQPGIPLKKLLGYMAEAAKGIDDLNQLGIYHRDIKPANLLLFYDHVKLGDLGLAKLVGASTGTHTRAGTFGYLPPEAWEGKTSETIDLYGLAASYVKLRTGREPFGESPQEILYRQRQGQPILDGLTEAEKPLVLAALHPDPEKRFKRGAKAWVRALYQALKSPPHPPPKQSPLQEEILKASAISEEKPFGMVPVGPAKAEPRPISPSAPELPEPKTSVLQEVKQTAIRGAIVGAIRGAILGAILGAIVGAIVGPIVGSPDYGIEAAILGAIRGAIGGAILGAIVLAIAGWVGNAPSGAEGGAIIGAILGAIGGAIGGAIVGAIVGAILGAIFGAIVGAIFGAIRGPIGGAIIGAIFGAIFGAILGGIGGAIGLAIFGAIGGAIFGASKKEH
jgi:hypothetical protein